jgi:hypothetical protein
MGYQGMFYDLRRRGDAPPGPLFIVKLLKPCTFGGYRENGLGNTVDYLAWAGMAKRGREYREERAGRRESGRSVQSFPERFNLKRKKIVSFPDSFSAAAMDYRQSLSKL